MAEYTKQVWQCGDTITADKMNHIEEGIENAQNGYECEENYTLLLEETATTAEQAGGCGATLTYSKLITADAIKVTFDGVEYECNVHIMDGLAGKMYGYGGVGEGASDFSEYPFAILSARDMEVTTQANNGLFTPSAGTHTIKIETLEPIATTTPCFNAAVKSATPGPLWVEFDSSDANALYYDKTPRQVEDALSENRIVCMKDGGGRIGYFFSKSTLTCLFITAKNNAVSIRTLTADGLDQKLSERGE